MREFKVTLPLPPSVNHCYTRRRKIYFKNGKRKTRVMNVLTKAAEQWMEDAREKNVDALKACDWEVLDERVVVELRVWWPDRRRRDAHNLLKLLCDSLEGFVSKDDKWMLTRVMEFDYDKGHPRVEVVAYAYEG